MTPRLIFVADTPMPPRAREYERLAGVAQTLLDQREQGYPAAIDAGKLTRDAADRGLRIMRAIAAQWRAVRQLLDLPDPADFPAKLGASWAEMVAELEIVATRARERAQAFPGDRTVREQAELADALLWHQRPTAPHCAFPHIWLDHEYAQFERRQERRRAG